MSHDGMHVIKAHAYGNDFLFVRRSDVPAADLPAAARRLCDRHRGAGADGLILYELTPEGASMRLINADGSPAELSGNGLRALAAIVIRHRGNASQVVAGAAVVITTDAGPRPLTLVDRTDPRFTFRAGMGQPSNLRTSTLAAGGEDVARVGLLDRQPAVRRARPAARRRAVRASGRRSSATRVPARHRTSSSPSVETPDRVRIRIWERGVGPTESSGTGACAAAVAAIAHGRAARSVDVVAPGGSAARRVGRGRACS